MKFDDEICKGVSCPECSFNKGEDGCLLAKRLDEIEIIPEPCEDAISRQAVVGYLCTHCPDDAECFEDCDDIKNIKVLPPANPTKIGHWIEHPEIETSVPEYLMFYECSECGDKLCFCKPDIHKKRFCNYCGCRMVEPQERISEE